MDVVLWTGGRSCRKRKELLTVLMKFYKPVAVETTGTLDSDRLDVRANTFGDTGYTK